MILNRSDRLTNHFLIAGGLCVEKGNKFFLKGLSSSCIFDGNSCDPTTFATYTSVNKFIDWIESVGK